MAEVFSFLQKVVLIAIFAWLGIQFSAPDKDDEQSKNAPSQTFVTLLR